MTKAEEKAAELRRNGLDKAYEIVAEYERLFRMHDGLVWLQEKVAAALAERDAEIERLNSHLPDCCKNETCDQEENILPSDVVAQVMNSLPKGVKMTTDEYTEIADKIGDLSRKAVKAAIKDREAKLAAAEARLREAREIVEYGIKYGSHGPLDIFYRMARKWLAAQEAK